jgi:hypothetical protein
VLELGPLLALVVPLVRPGVDAEIDAADDVIHRTEVLKFIPFMDGRNVGMIDRTSRLSPSLETAQRPGGLALPHQAGTSGQPIDEGGCLLPCRQYPCDPCLTFQARWVGRGVEKEWPSPEGLRLTNGETTNATLITAIGQRPVNSPTASCYGNRNNRLAVCPVHRLCFRAGFGHIVC